MPGNSSDIYSLNNSASFVRGGKQYFDHLVQLILSATKTVHLQTYIYAEDETGLFVADALLLAAQRGVKVFLMVDGYASQGLSDLFVKRLRDGGINIKFFEPLFRTRRFYLGRRLHHKLCVIDMNFALVGGINIADHYNDMPGRPAWLDFALSVEGEIVWDLLVLCQKTWNGFLPLKSIPAMQDIPVFYIPEDAKRLMRMRRNDWVRRKQQISRSYIEMFARAQSHIIILSSYFLPGGLFRGAISKARARGVKVTVILAGVSDIKMAKMAERYMYEWLLSKGVRIMEYNETVLHGKLAVCDGKWMTLGSFNINDISAYASVELNLEVDSSIFAHEVEQYLEQNIINHCAAISDSYVSSHTSIWQRLLEWAAFVSTRALFFFFTFYFKQVREG